MSGLAALVAALPKCAATCLLASVENSTCAVTDDACVCHNVDLNTKATACVMASCTIRESLTTKNLTSTACGIPPHVDHSYVPVFIAFVTLSAVSVLLRVVTRLHTRAPVWWDDFIIALSFLGAVAFATISFIMKSHGLGTDIWAISFGNIELVLKSLYTLFILYITSRDLVRLSILLLYHRIFGHIPLARRLIHVTFGLVIACATAFDLAIIFGCTPIDYFWTGWDGQHEGYCISTNAIFWAGAFVVIAIDLWIIVIPLPFIARLKLSIRKRILSAIMFAFGIFVIIVSFYRLQYINRFTLSNNPTADFIDVGIWSGLELYVGIICACLPNINHLLRPVYVRLGLMRSSPQPEVGAQQHGREAKTSSEDMIHAMTTVRIEHHQSESQVYLNSSGGRNTTTSSDDIELGRNKMGETNVSVWS
ncbi:hypothetical protein F4861DRAFT_379498 [Xylaria intraflava]|nr:hypothetical protein F4861DRAFT_379498 [Xylaria intraflava]